MKIKICILIVISILILLGIIIYVNNGKNSNYLSNNISTKISNSPSSLETGQNMETSNNDIILDIEENTKHYVTDDGAIVWVYKTVSDEVVRCCDQFIIDNKCNLSGIEFIFLNSSYTFSPQYVLDNLIDYYSDFLPENCPNSNDIYYVQEIYNDTVLGFFVIDSNGEVIDTYNIQSVDEISDIDFSTNITDIDANRIAIEAVDSQNTNVISCVKYLNYANETNTMCYCVKFNDNFYVIIDAKTGDILKKQ